MPATDDGVATFVFDRQRYGVSAKVVADNVCIMELPDGRFVEIRSHRVTSPIPGQGNIIIDSVSEIDRDRVIELGRQRIPDDTIFNMAKSQAFSAKPLQ